KELIHIHVEQDTMLVINIQLKDEAVNIGEVLVEAKSVAQETREKGYSVEVIESKGQKNLSKNINQVLKTAPGINIRENGGLGSGFKLSLNGLSGNQIRYFIDGMPMENFGSSLSLNNFPINLIEKLEVYKGAVPVYLGSDALGGAINIITDQWYKNFLDAAFSYGSFNTLKSSVNGQYSDHTYGFFLKGSFFHNYSANNYTMHNVTVYDLELGNPLNNTTVKRFHDDYSSTMFTGEIGLFNKIFADKISLKLLVSGGRKNYQHPDNDPAKVMGDFHTKNESLLFSGSYIKKISKLNIKAYALFGEINETVVDTGTRKFNWKGDF